MLPTNRRPDAGRTWPVLAAISAGGVVGSLARYTLGEIHPHRLDEFAWATFAVNVSGCLLIGAVVVLVTDLWPRRSLLRPFLGTGVLGGYTTFSAYIVDIQQMVAAGAAHTALAYLAGTLIAALVAITVGMTATEYGIRIVGNRKERR